MKSPDDEKLERLIHRTLRELPARRAPHSLEARVLAELERRAALPWWRKSFAHWPMAARVAFLVAGAGAVAFVLYAAGFVQTGFDSARLAALSTQLSTFADAALTVGRGIGEFGHAIGRSLPPLWLYGGLAFVGAMYAALFGLGAAAYRTLYVNR